MPSVLLECLLGCSAALSGRKSTGPLSAALASRLLAICGKDDVRAYTSCCLNATATRSCLPVDMSVVMLQSTNQALCVTACIMTECVLLVRNESMCHNLLPIHRRTACGFRNSVGLSCSAALCMCKTLETFCRPVHGAQAAPSTRRTSCTLP